MTVVSLQSMEYGRSLTAQFKRGSIFNWNIFTQIAKIVIWLLAMLTNSMNEKYQVAY